MSILDPFGQAVLSIHESLTLFIYNLNPVQVLRELQEEEDASVVMEAESTDEDIEANVERDGADADASVESLPTSTGGSPSTV